MIVTAIYSSFYYVLSNAQVCPFAAFFLSDDCGSVSLTVNMRVVSSLFDVGLKSMIIHVVFQKFQNSFTLEPVTIIQ